MQSIPEKINPIKFGQKQISLSGSYPVEYFPRIKDITEDEVMINLDFFIENNHIPCLKGKAIINAKLVCQRCLNKVNIKINTKIKLAFIKNKEQEKQLNSDFETILITSEELSLTELITDEVLISIPMIAMHKHNCSKYENKNLSKLQKNNPFAILKQLKNKE